jgi:hypothetical protein
MSPTELKAVFKRMLLGVAAPAMMLSSCGSAGIGGPPNPCQNYKPTYNRVLFGDAGIPDGGYSYCVDATQDAGQPAVDCPTLCEGRHPAGRLETDLSGLRGEGGYLARMAHFEAASVAAFLQLADELEAAGAPQGLVKLAEASARDEVKHAQAVGALARKRGAVPPAPRLTPSPPRNVFELALDNAREGCVREAFGALIGLHQATHATSPDVKAAMQKVADDEIAHAAFSFELARWLDGMLSDAERARVARARDEALAALLHQAFAFHDMPWRDALGLPAADTLFELAHAFRAQLAVA